MVEVCSDISGKRDISSEKNSSSECEKCISEILDCLAVNGITCETAYALLYECKRRIETISGQIRLIDLNNCQGGERNGSKSKNQRS